MASTFQREVENRIGNDSILMPKVEEMEGQRLEDLSFLEEVGLLQTIDVFAAVTRIIKRRDNENTYLREQDLILAFESPSDVNFQIISLTRAGREIAGILEPADPLTVLEKVGRAIADQVTTMEIRRITEKINDNIMTVRLKTLKAKQD